MQPKYNLHELYIKYDYFLQRLVKIVAKTGVWKYWNVGFNP